MIIRAAFSDIVIWDDDDSGKNFIEKSVKNASFEYAWAVFGRTDVKFGFSRTKESASRSAKHEASVLGVSSYDIEIVRTFIVEN